MEGKPWQLIQCRACSTAERTATNIVIAPIARVHRAAPCSLHLCSLRSLLPAPAPRAPAPAPCSRCSLLRSSRSCSCSCSLLFAPAHAAHAAHAAHSCTRAPFTHCSLHSLLPSLTAPFTHCSLHSLLPLGFSTALGHFRAPCVRAIPYLGFASQRLA